MFPLAPPRSRSAARLELAVLTALSFAAHFWRLFAPRVVVFDEMHYKRFAGHYLEGTFYYDVHPPLANLLYAAVAKLSGAWAQTLLGVEPVVGLRVLPALFGSLIAPLAYVILRQLGAARRVATLAAFALLCENALLVETRLALIEPLMIGFGLIAVACYLASRDRAPTTRWPFLAASAVSAGCAAASKWTGASALAIVLAAWFVEMLRARAGISRILREGLLLVALPAAVYLGTFAVHFALLPRHGTGLTILTVRFRSTLTGWEGYDPARRLSFLSKVSEVHAAMRRGNRTLEGVTHPGASPWYTWPIMKHPIGYWQEKDASTGRQRNIILLGNPVVWWGAPALLLMALVHIVRRRDLVERHGYALAFLLGAVFINFAPFVPIRRVMYLYHYLFALVWLVMLAAFGAGIAAGWQYESDDRLFTFHSRGSAAAYWIAGGLIVLGFVYFLPLTYGWPLSQAAYDQRFWVLHPFSEF